MNKIALAAMLSVAAIFPAAAQETIDWMHIASIPEEVAIMEAAAREYEAANPGITINMQFLENEAFKAKLTTLLQSDAAPDIFYSWGGGVLTEQAAAGVLRPVEDIVDPATAEALGAGGMSAFTRDGHLYGLPQQVSEVVLWYNKALFEQAGVDPASLETWDGFLAAVQTFKDAGITPLAVGAKDKWPAHFWWSKLVVRLAGQEAFNQARVGENGGFSAEPFIRAGEIFLELAALEPFQEGFLAASYGDASGYFGDGKAAMHLMGDWDYGAMKDNSASKAGIPDEQLGILPFPTIEGGAGDASDTLGGINGWLFHKNAPDAAVKFMEWYTSAEVAARFGNAGFFIPIAAGAGDGMTNPFKVQIAQNINNAHWHAIFFDQELGPQIGGVVNDISAELAGNALTADEAAELVEEAAADLR